MGNVVQNEPGNAESESSVVQSRQQPMVEIPLELVRDALTEIKRSSSSLELEATGQDDSSKNMQSCEVRLQNIISIRKDLRRKSCDDILSDANIVKKTADNNKQKRKSAPVTRKRKLTAEKPAPEKGKRTKTTPAILR